VTTTTPGIQLRPGGQRGWPPAAAGRSGAVACLLYRAGRRPAVPGRRPLTGGGADHPADRGFKCAPGRQDDRGQHRVTGAALAAGRARLPGHGRLPADQLPVLTAGLGPGRRRAAGRLQVKNTAHELACQPDVDLPGTRPGGPPCIIIAGSGVIDSRWVASQRVQPLGRRIAMTCSFSLEPDT
jgi:hypothetical protein